MMQNADGESTMRAQATQHITIHNEQPLQQPKSQQGRRPVKVRGGSHHKQSVIMKLLQRKTMTRQTPRTTATLIFDQTAVP